MNVLVDTSVWSLALRKKTLTDLEITCVAELRELIKELRVVMIGPIRQELLSGISAPEKHQLLKDRLQAFKDLTIETENYEKAAEFSNTCRSSGIQGSHTDFLICAVAYAYDMSIFTTDKDFMNYSKVLDVRLHEVRDEIGGRGKKTT
jgi:hypothetical protein